MGNPRIIVVFAVLCLLMAIFTVVRYASDPSRVRSSIELILGLGALGCAVFLGARAWQLSRPSLVQSESLTRASKPTTGRVWLVSLIGLCVGAIIGTTSALVLGWSANGAIAFAMATAVVTGGTCLLIFKAAQWR
jgi:hypothetical protein